MRPRKSGLALHNGDGFAFATNDGITGFRGDVCEGLVIRCKSVPDLRTGMTLFRNVNSAFEKTLETQTCRRYIGVALKVKLREGYILDADARTEDGRTLSLTFEAGSVTAQNGGRIESMLKEQLSKRSGHYEFRLEALSIECDPLPLLSASFINSIRRRIADRLNEIPVSANSLGRRKPVASPVLPVQQFRPGELMRSKYCVRYELGMCGTSQPLYITNNGRRLRLDFDCAACEMTVSPA